MLFGNGGQPLLITVDLKRKRISSKYHVSGVALLHELGGHFCVVGCESGRNVEFGELHANREANLIGDPLRVVFGEQLAIEDGCEIVATSVLTVHKEMSSVAVDQGPGGKLMRLLK